MLMNFRDTFHAAFPSEPLPEETLRRFAALEARLQVTPRVWTDGAGPAMRSTRLVVTTSEHLAPESWLALAAGCELSRNHLSHVLFIPGVRSDGNPGQAAHNARQRERILRYSNSVSDWKQLCRPSSQALAFGGLLSGPWPGRRFTAIFSENLLRSRGEAQDPERLEWVVSALSLQSGPYLRVPGIAVVLAPPRSHVSGGDFVARMCARGWEWVDLSESRAPARPGPSLAFNARKA